MPDTEAVDSNEIFERKKEYDKEEPVSRYNAGGNLARPADMDDEHRSWTVQSAKPMPKGAWDKEPITKFHPSELPNPEVAMAAGLMPLVNRSDLVDADNETMPPSGNYPVDHPKRDVHRRKVAEAGGVTFDDEFKRAKALTEVHVEDADTDDEVPPGTAELTA